MLYNSPHGNGSIPTARCSFSHISATSICITMLRGILRAHLGNASTLSQHITHASGFSKALYTALVFAIHHPLLFPPNCYYYRSAFCRASYLVEYVWSSFPMKPFVVFEYDQGQTKYGFGVGASNSSRGLSLSSTSLSPWGWLSSYCYAEWSVVSIMFLVWWFTRVAYPYSILLVLWIGSRSDSL